MKAASRALQLVWRTASTTTTTSLARSAAARCLASTSRCSIWTDPPVPPSKLSTDVSLTDLTNIPERNGYRVKAVELQTSSTAKQVRHVVNWNEGGPRTVLIVCGRRSTADTSEPHALEIATFLREQYPDVIVLYDQPTMPLGEGIYSFQEDEIEYLDRVVDLVIAVGGSNTLNRVSQLTPRISAPVLTLFVTTPGLAMSYSAKEYEKWVPKALDGGFFVTPRMRLKSIVRRPDEPQSSEFVFMHEINLQRGNQFLTDIDCSVNGIKLTKAKADGLLVATPTGSIGYSLSAGSAIVHPSLQGILLTPVCPRSLSFRPALLPAEATVLFEVAKTSKGSAVVTVDDDVAKKEIHLQPGHSLEVTKADYPLYTIEFPPRGVNWVSNLQRLLRWRYRKFRTFVEKDYVSITEPVSDIHNSYGEEAFLSSLGKGKDKGGAQ